MKDKFEKSKIFECILFLILFLCLFSIFTHVLERKSMEGPWNYYVKIRGFKNEPKNSIEVLGFGSSHMYCTLNPLVLWEAEKISSYVLATQNQPVIASYHYMLEALKTQNPKIVILEAYKLIDHNEYPPEAVAHDAIDPLPWSKNKIDLINSIVAPKERKYYYFNILKYHSRWQEVNESDLDFFSNNLNDLFHGYVYLNDQNAIEKPTSSYNSEEREQFSQVNQKALQKIVSLSKEKNFKLIFLISPYSKFEVNSKIINELYYFAKQNNISVLDMNKEYESIGFDSTLDFYDDSHLNVNGARKASIYIGKYLKENFGVWSEQSEYSDKWNEDVATFHKIIIDN